MDFPNFYHVYTLLHGHIANKKVDEIAFLLEEVWGGGGE
jgi:hypothetical protein